MRTSGPKTGQHPEPLPGWLSTLGVAGDADGPAIERLVRALRHIGYEWAAVAAARLILLMLFTGIAGLTNALAHPQVMIAMAAWLVFDTLLIHAAARLTRHPPNRNLAWYGVLVFLSSAAFSACATFALEGRTAAVLASTLGPVLLAQAIFGRLRSLGILLAMGTLVPQLILLHDPRFAAPHIVLLLGLTLALLREHRTTARLAREKRAGRGAISGRQARALLQDVEQSGRGWFWETDRIGRITYISEQLAAQMRCTTADLVGTPFSALLAPLPLSDEAQRSLGFHFSTGSAFTEISARAAIDDEERWWSISGQPVVTAFGQFIGFRGSGTDLTEMRRSQAEVARLATVDSLTGLANRSSMMQALEQALNDRHDGTGSCALFLLDLDRFKDVNDTMGHPAGDALLRQVAERLLGIMGTHGKIGRIGGDEFQILLPGLPEVMALAKLADNIIHTLSEPYLVDGSQVMIGASIGIALAPADGNNCDALIRNADLALYSAKGEGRGQFRFFVPAMHAKAEDRRQLEVELRHALVEGGLHLDYQPVVCAATERITGFEALIRWDHPARGPISPATFIPIAEEAGLVGGIGEWVLRTACATATRWPDGTRVAVNVSPIQFSNTAFPNIVMSALANSGLSPERLELEITENVFLEEHDNTGAMFAQLKSLGVRLALDDFGTGYSALGYLKSVPFDKIKIDQSFVRGAAIKGSRNAAIVKSIVTLADALSMETTAEGAETLEELALIRSLGCSHIQGFVYGRPMTVGATIDLLSENEGRAVAKGHTSSREPRMTMLRTIALLHGANRYATRMRNISTSGAMIEGLSDVPVGTAFTLEFTPGYTVDGLCRWSKEDRMGIEFAMAVNVEHIRAGEEPPPQTAIPTTAGGPTDHRRTG
jgi:diguanylate cyclase (GGDEF)-like protein